MILDAISRAKALSTAFKQMPDSAAVWDFNEFKAELVRQLPYLKTAAPASARIDTFMGLQVILDRSLARGTIELRLGETVLRTIHLDLDL